MEAVSAERMREIDRRCIEGLGIPAAVLMNNAGAAVFKEVKQGPVLVVCGKGNNGGDGFVVARLALCAGLDTAVLLLAPPEEITGDAAIFLRAYQRLGGKWTVGTSSDQLRGALKRLPPPETVVDAMLGTGAKGAVREPVRTAIRNWPQVYTVAVDMPSGLDADSGIAGVDCVHAHVTVTLHLPKIGFKNPAAAPFLGRLVVADIGIPAVCSDDDAWAHLNTR